MAQLERYLKKLPAADYQDALDYFNEYFDEQGPELEAQTIEQLGSPKAAAAELLANLLDDKVDQHQEASFWQQHQTFWIALVALLALPIGIPGLLVVLVFFLTFWVILASLGLVVVSFLFAGLVLGLASLYFGFQTLVVSLPAALVMIGCGLMGLALSVLVAFVIYLVVKWLALQMIKVIQWLLRKGGR